MDEQESILKDFLVECAEGLARLDQEFVALEKEPSNLSLLASIFRTFHTIKGTCGFLGLPKLEGVAHRSEDILSRMRDREMQVTPEGITLLLEAVDAIKEILVHIEAAGKEPEKDYEAIRQKLSAFLFASVTPPVLTSPSLLPPSGPPAAEVAPEKNTAPLVAAPFPGLSEEGKREGVPETSVQGKAPGATESSIRVDVGLLDKLMNLVGELVLARNQLLERVRRRDDVIDTATAQRMNLVTTELQDTVMKTRMQPIRNVWDKFPRVVRDLARANGKEVELVMEGAETELDKTLLEAVKDPLTHIVRNAVDHGIEAQDVRRERGKPAKGTLFLNAFHEGGQINLAISDDGRGIDLEKVKRKAVEKGLISSEAASRLSEREGFNLIFLPGLSTAEKITSVSGRGVGMDVVKTNIEKIGGTVELISRLGKGTELRIKIPLTLAIIPALMVTSGGEYFAISQANLLELVRVDEEGGEKVEVIHGAEFYRLRGTLLPLLSLRRVLRLEEVGEDPLRGASMEISGTNIVVLKAGECPFGLIVDAVNDSEEIVVKPLGRQLKGLSMFAGATILGDGRVALILDVAGIAQEGGLFQPAAQEADIQCETVAAEGRDGKRQAMILFSVSGRDRFAVPLSLVARLEEFEPNKIEQAAGREVIQYREDLLPLVRLGPILGTDFSPGAGGTLPAIVFSKNKKNVGLVVGRILDIVETEVVLHPPPIGKRGMRGSLVIDGQTTDLLDIDQIIEDTEPGWMEEAIVNR